MSKKTFKDKTEHLDRFFSEPEEKSRTHEPQGTHRTQNRTNPVIKTRTPPEQKYYRINLKLKAEYKEYLSDASWAVRKSITEYINDLIEADKAAKDTSDT